MKDGVTKGTGNSRYLKSAITDTTTWEQFRDMLRGGTLPIDLNGVNTAGWQVVGDGLNKANLLPDSVATALGLTGNPQVKDALLGLSLKDVQIQFGTYVGTGSSTASLTFNFEPRLVTINGEGNKSDVTGVLVYGCTNVEERDYGSGAGRAFYLTNIEWNGKTVSWTGGSTSKADGRGITYYYFAIG